MMIEKMRMYVKKVFEWDRFVENYKRTSNLHSKISMQLFTSFAFFILSVANVFVGSYLMLTLTSLGCVTNLVFAFLAEKRGNGSLCAFSSIGTCSVLFAFFVIYGGNDGFACLWVVLLPLLAMIAMDFRIGLCASVFFQFFLIAVFWTPLRTQLLYRYNDQFCLRFPMFFFVTFVLGLIFTVSMRKSAYNECRHLAELEELTANAQLLARTDPLTKLANRRFAYEEFDARYIAEDCPHCVVMGDIDSFKIINDTYGHKFGDEVLVVFAEYINSLLPDDYLKVRWGGEEFLFAANVPANEVYAQIEKLREAFSAHEFNAAGVPVHITITFGLAEYTGQAGLEKAISCADSRMYRGKKGTKNCTVVHD